VTSPWATPNDPRKTEPPSDPFPLLEETDEGTQLPTVSEWLRAGAPTREVTHDDRQG
jgi:hypothetical protein